MVVESKRTFFLGLFTSAYVENRHWKPKHGAMRLKSGDEVKLASNLGRGLGVLTRAWTIRQRLAENPQDSNMEDNLQPYRKICQIEQRLVFYASESIAVLLFQGLAR